ncbi:amidohydrolase family protein [Pigmentiphaga litoralis]|uniref:amidohydrolase family protein n=1 Tax=Pigmentiphaga litoralis TaxID=516702 RepID=UPI003B43234E
MSDTLSPAAPFPRGSCDSHAHLFGALDTHPVLPGSHFVPHPSPLTDYAAMLRVLGCDRAVLVQPSVYGTDNRLIAGTLADAQAVPASASGLSLRAVAVVNETIADSELEAMHALGFRGVRINTASATPGLTLPQVRVLAERIRHLGWHVQCFVDLKRLSDVTDELARLPVPIVIDHFGKVDASAGVDAPPFQALLALLAHDHCWAKLMGPYFVSARGPGFDDVAPLAQAMARIAPDRLVWGTDWPHPSAHGQMPNDGTLANLLTAWIPDAGLRHRVLVDNPARLYGF